MKVSTLSYILNLLLAITLWILWAKCCKAPSGQATDNQQDSITYWKNKAGDTVASVLLLAQVTRERDSMAKVLDIRPKTIVQYVRINTHTRDTIKGDGNTVVIRDTVTGDILSMSELFASPYYTAHATIQASGVGSELMLEVYDTISMVQRKVKGGVQLDIMLANPHSRVTGVMSFTVPVPRTTWALSAEFDALYLDRNFHILTGGNLNITRPWGSFGVSGGISDFSKAGYGRAYGRFQLLPIPKK